MKNLGDMLKMAKNMQSKLQDLEAELAALEATGESGGGMVSVVLNGNYEARNVTIEPSLIAESNAEFLGDLVAAAINDAAHRMENLREEKRAEMLRSAGLPAGVQLPF